MVTEAGKVRLRRIAPLLALCLLGLVFSSGAHAAGGTALAWGYNYAGQVGNGTTNPVGPCNCVPLPTPVSGLSGVTQIEGGYEQGLALLDNGTVMSWGSNEDGQLGDGTTTDRLTPVPVPGLSNVVAVSGGRDFSLALRADGTVKAWGRNEFGALGSGDIVGPEKCIVDSCVRSPITVPGISNAIAIASGDEFSLALLADGTVLGWGWDEYGMSGNGTGTINDCVCIASPQPVPGLSGVVAISVNDRLAMALLSDGTVRTWGKNERSAAGTGSQSNTPPCFCVGPVSPSGLSNVRQVEAGGEHGIVVLSEGGEVRSWGNNRWGQVGNGTFSVSGCECVPTPVTVAGLQPIAVSAGSDHSYALLANGTGVSWGEGQSGQLADGGLVSRNQPSPITGVSGASELTATDFGGYALVGPSQALSVALAGAGSGKVGGDGILCPPSCTDPVPQGQVKILRPLPDQAGGFAGFSGPCTGTGACQVKMSSDQTVTATFGVPKGTALTGSDVNNKKKRATFTFSAPGAITGYECRLIKPKKKKKKKHGKGKKHRVALANRSPKPKPPAFAPCAGPAAYKNLRPGKYTFEVRALDILGPDANPAVKKFQVKKPKAKKRKKGK